MLTTAAVAALALALIVFGELVRVLFHFTVASLSIAGGIVLILAIPMVVGIGDSSQAKFEGEDRIEARAGSRWPCRICSTRWASLAW